MRLLPRSAKGTWLLAAAVWAVLCALGWWWAPVLPLAQWTNPDQGEFRFLRGHEAVTYTVQAFPLIGPLSPIIPPGPIRVWDVRSGRLLRTYPPEDLKMFLPSDPPTRPLPSGTVHDVFSGDGRVVAGAALTADKTWEIGVWEVGSFRRRTVIRLPTGTVPEPLQLNVTGTVVAARLGDGFRSLGDGVRESATFACWDTLSGREICRLPDTQEIVLGVTGDILAAISTLHGEDGSYRLSVYDLKTGERRFLKDLYADWFYVVPQFISSDERVIAAPNWRGATSLFRTLARRIGVNWPFGRGDDVEAMTLFDARTGRELGRVAGQFVYSRWSPDGTLLVTLDSDRQIVRVWEIPLRKPAGWIAIAAGIIAVPIASLAWWRSRRLRREVA